ncbi:MAG: proprotein convertase P-domain-containing protein, partial [Bacteroidota bacterium]
MNFPYNGYLDIFTAGVAVEPCATYTIKLAIGDGSPASGNDSNYDSAVFLEAKSFESSAVQVEAVAVSLDGSVIEGCTEANLNFSLPFPAEADYPLNFNISGTAINGVDYQSISTAQVIPAGMEGIDIPIIAEEDNLPEGVETLEIEVIISDCKRDTFVFNIKDNVLAPPTLGNDTTICAGNSVALDGTLNTNTITAPSFTFNTPTTIEDKSSNPFVVIDNTLQVSIDVTGVEPPILNESLLQSVCLDITHGRTEDLDIYLVSPDGIIIELTTDNGGNSANYSNTCFTMDASTVISNGTAPFTGAYLPEGVWSDLWDGNYRANGTWQLLIGDDTSGPSTTSEINSWSITFNSTYQLSYSWSPTNGLSCSDCPAPTATPTSSTNYQLVVSDSYGCSGSESRQITVEDNLIAPTINCSNISNNSVDFIWLPIPDATAYEVNVDGAGWTAPNNGGLAHTVSGLNLNETVNIEVRGIGNCGADIGTASCTTLNCGTISTLSAVASSLSCFGETDASIDITAMDGQQPYTYTLKATSNTTGTFNNLGAGWHYFSVADANGCSAQDSIEI